MRRVLAALAIIVLSSPAFAQSNSFTNMVERLPQMPPPYQNGDALAMVRNGIAYQVRIPNIPVPGSFNSILNYSGADPTGASNSDAAYLACTTSGKDCLIPQGRFVLSCADHFPTPGTTIFGETEWTSTIQMPNGCARGTNPWMRGANFRDLTVDINNATAAANTTILGVSDAANLSPRVERVRIINGTTHMFLVAVGGISQNSTNPIIRNNYFALTAADTNNNRCILFTPAGGGTISGGFVTDNVCVNTGMGFDASNLTVARNDIRGWAYSAGIFFEQSASTHHNQVIDNRLHDSATTLDVDNTPAVGVEIWAADSTVAGNRCWNTGGVCLDFGGKRILVAGNWAVGVNKHNSANVGAFVARYSSATYNASDSMVTGNKAQDDGSGLQYYGYAEEAGGLTGIVVAGNDFDGNATGPMFIVSPTTASIETSSTGTKFKIGGGLQFATGNAASSVNYLLARGAATGNRPAIIASGTDTDVDISLEPQAGGGVIIKPNAGSQGLGILSNGNNTLLALTNSIDNTWNPLVDTGDISLIWKGTTIDNSNAGGFVLAPWSAASRGMKMDYQGNTVLYGGALSSTYNSAGAYPLSQTNGWALLSNLPNNGGNEVGLLNLKENDAGGVGFYQKTGASSAVALGKIYNDPSDTVEVGIPDPAGSYVVFGKKSSNSGWVGTVGNFDFELRRQNAAVAKLVSTGFDALIGIKNNGKLVISQTAPTIASGGCTTGSAQSVSASNGSAAFAITLGGATCGSTIVLTLPAATAGWVCDAHDITTPASNVVEQSAGGSTTSVTLTNYVRTTGVAGNFTGADVLAVKCSAY
jgi:hypothetical protein